MNNANVPKTIQLQVFGYRLDMTNPDEKAEYDEILKKLDGVEKWQYAVSLKTQIKFQFPKEGETIEIDTKCLFDNQWNTECGIRVWQWVEYSWPNHRIKDGYYLVMTEEFTQLLKDTFKCGYCGHQYHKPEQKWCDKCLGSEYLSESELPLLRLKPLKGKVSKVKFPDELKEAYRIAQEQSLAIRCEKEKQRLREKYKQAERNAGIEFCAKIWLLEHNIPINNFIFYDHTQKCTFGWNKPLTKDQIESLKLKLNGFPFPKMLDFKVA